MVCSFFSFWLPQTWWIECIVQIMRKNSTQTQTKVYLNDYIKMRSNRGREREPVSKKSDRWNNALIHFKYEFAKKREKIVERKKTLHFKIDGVLLGIWSMSPNKKKERRREKKRGKSALVSLLNQIVWVLDNNRYLSISTCQFSTISYWLSGVCWMPGYLFKIADKILMKIVLNSAAESATSNSNYRAILKITWKYFSFRNRINSQFGIVIQRAMGEHLWVTVSAVGILFDAKAHHACMQAPIKIRRAIEIQRPR